MDYGCFWGWFWLAPFFFMIVMCLFARPFFRRARGRRAGREIREDWIPFGCWSPRYGTSAGEVDESPQRILDRRYASGEITKEQYEAMRADIERGDR